MCFSVCVCRGASDPYEKWNTLLSQITCDIEMGQLFRVNRGIPAIQTKQGRGDKLLRLNASKNENLFVAFCEKLIK